VSAGQASPGDTLMYTITVGNSASGPSATVWMTDELPAEFVIAPGSLSASHGSVGLDNGVITWTHHILEGAEGYKITFTGTIPSGITYARIVNTAQITGTGELVEASAETIAYDQMGDLDNEKTTKTASHDQVAPGDVLTYVINVKTEVLAPVYDARLTDTVPSEFTLLPGTLEARSGQVGHSGRVITWTHDIGEGFSRATVRRLGHEHGRDCEPHPGLHACGGRLCQAAARRPRGDQDC
jgi:uncharacterized repeat protein (TIGR01451 family)